MTMPPQPPRFSSVEVKRMGCSLVPAAMILAPGLMASVPWEEYWPLTRVPGSMVSTAGESTAVRPLMIQTWPLSSVLSEVMWPLMVSVGASAIARVAARPAPAIRREKLRMGDPFMMGWFLHESEFHGVAELI